MDQNNNTNADDDSDCEGLKVYDNDDDDSNDDDVMNDDESLDATRKPQRLFHKSLPRDTRDVNAVVTEEDLKRVATYVSEKRYDSEYGSSCHQCRQKTNDMKTICRSSNCVGVRGQFCGPCLRNRYGEDAKECLKNPHWVCPPCRGICNCSFCRRRAGKASTGILIHVAREMGFEDCNSYLQSLRKRTNPEN